MKIIVDELPKESKDCIFSCCTNPYYGHHSCDLWQGRGCEPSKCNFLKPITDFHAEKVIEKHDDGSYIVQQYDIIEALKPKGSADMPKEIVCNCTTECPICHNKNFLTIVENVEMGYAIKKCFKCGTIRYTEINKLKEQKNE